jgi:hypothetical protein
MPWFTARLHYDRVELVTKRGRTEHILYVESREVYRLVDRGVSRTEVTNAPKPAKGGKRA